MNTQDVAKVTDFGIARALSSPSEDLTQAGNVMGTATYFSPEQAQGFEVDARSDLYSLGVVMYEVLCGRPPFSGETPVAIAYKHVQENPPKPSTVISDMPPGLEAVIMKLLSKRPEDRYLSADDLSADLKRWLAGETTVAERAVAGAVVGDPTVAQSQVDPDATVIAPAVVGAAAAAAAAGAAVASQHGGDVAGATVTGGTTDTAGTPPSPPTDLAAPDDEGSSRRTGVFVGTGVVLLALLAGLAFWLIKSLDDESTMVKVPPVIGLTKDEAIAKLTDIGFNPVVEEERTDEATSGVVFDQNPEANVDLELGSDVTIKVSSGSPLDVVPAGLVGQPYEGVEELLKRAGFVVDVVFVDSNETKGVVIGTDPDEGQDVEEGGTITLLVSNGPQASDVPAVAGMTVDQATEALTDAGFVVGEVTLVPSDSVPAGQVISSDPTGPRPRERPSPSRSPPGQSRSRFPR